MSPKVKRKEILEDLKNFSKKALNKLAKMFEVKGRNKMKKTDLLEALDSKKINTKKLVTASEKIKKKQEKKMTKSTDKKPIQPVPDEKLQVHPEESPSSIPAQEIPAEAMEAGTLWLGEEGPDLPDSYGITRLQALPRDPYWAFVYWEISETTRNRLLNEEGEWVFDTTMPILKVIGETQEVVQEVPVLLDARSWYICLPPSGRYAFDLGLKHQDGRFLSLMQSNWILLPPAEPSHLTGDEEWAIIEEKYEQLLKISGGMEMAGRGGSAEAVPHVLRHRVRVPWKVPILQDLSASGAWGKSGRPLSGRPVSGQGLL